MELDPHNDNVLLVGVAYQGSTIKPSRFAEIAGRGSMKKWKESIRVAADDSCVNLQLPVCLQQGRQRV